MAVNTTTTLIAVGMMIALAFFATFLYMLFQCTERENANRSDSCPGSPSAQEPLRRSSHWPYFDANSRRRLIKHSVSSPTLLAPDESSSASALLAHGAGASLSTSASTKLFLQEPEIESPPDQPLGSMGF